MNHDTPTQQHRIYLDNAAATATDARVAAVMAACARETFGNPDSIHAEGVAARARLEEARGVVARVLGAQPDEIVFTSGGTEGNNLATVGLARACLSAGTPYARQSFVTSTIEHGSVRASTAHLRAQGADVCRVPVDTDGFVDLAALRAALTAETVLVSLIFVHNELGTVARVREVVRELRRARAARGSQYPLLHLDASQAPAWVSCDVRTLHADLLTLDAQKCYGPKGVGVLYVRRGVSLAPVLLGDGGEGDVRPGTVPVPLAVGCAEALRLVEEERGSYVSDKRALRDRLVGTLKARIPDMVQHGPSGEERVANSACMSFPGVDAEQLVLELDARGVAISSRSACSARDLPGSAVVRALGKGEDMATSAVRVSLSRETTNEDVDTAIRAFVDAVTWLRSVR